jgi:hypothetical protein
LSSRPDASSASAGPLVTPARSTVAAAPAWAAPATAAAGPVAAESGAGSEFSVSAVLGDSRLAVGDDRSQISIN